MTDFVDLPLFVQPAHKQSKLAQAWEDCKKRNPQLLSHLARIALDYKHAGHDSWSINGVFEVMRWETRFTTGDLGLKCNNNHRAFAARDLMREYPELDGFFSLRQQGPQGHTRQITP